MRLDREEPQEVLHIGNGAGTPTLMKSELSRALREALFELEILPQEQEAALLGIYAVIDDLQEAIQRTEALDLAGR